MKAETYDVARERMIEIFKRIVTGKHAFSMYRLCGGGRRFKNYFVTSIRCLIQLGDSWDPAKTIIVMPNDSFDIEE
ncbi:hypothetical protein PENTCL1PPCAC_24242, partial [Pristionchus entomophagus]